MVAVDDVSVNNGWVGAGWGIKQLTDVIKKNRLITGGGGTNDISVLIDTFSIHIYNNIMLVRADRNGT